MAEQAMTLERAMNNAIISTEMEGLPLPQNNVSL